MVSAKDKFNGRGRIAITVKNICRRIIESGHGSSVNFFISLSVELPPYSYSVVASKILGQTSKRPRPTPLAMTALFVAQIDRVYGVPVVGKPLPLGSRSNQDSMGYGPVRRTMLLHLLHRCTRMVAGP